MSAAPSATAGKVSPPHGDGTATVGAEGPQPHPPLRRRLSSDGSTHSLKRMSSSSSRGSRGAYVCVCVFWVGCVCMCPCVCI